MFRSKHLECCCLVFYEKEVRAKRILQHLLILNFLLFLLRFNNTEKKGIWSDWMFSTHIMPISVANINTPVVSICGPRSEWLSKLAIPRPTLSVLVGGDNLIQCPTKHPPDTSRWQNSPHVIVPWHPRVSGIGLRSYTGSTCPKASHFCDKWLVPRPWGRTPEYEDLITTWPPVRPHWPVNKVFAFSSKSYEERRAGGGGALQN